jgi:hypothetical protein
MNLVNRYSRQKNSRKVSHGGLSIDELFEARHIQLAHGGNITLEEAVDLLNRRPTLMYPYMDMSRGVFYSDRPDISRPGVSLLEPPQPRFFPLDGANIGTYHRDSVDPESNPSIKRITFRQRVKNFLKDFMKSPSHDDFEALYNNDED